MRTLKLLLLLLLAGAVAPLARAASTAYATAMADGARLAAEGSWARARDAYAEALKSASTADARRWAQIRQADAGWRADVRPARDAASFAAARRALETLNVLVGEDPAAPPARDASWAAALESRADLLATSGLGGSPWPDRLAVLDHLAGQPPSDRAATEYVAFLQRAFLTPSGFYRPPALVSRLEDGARVGATADDRAWCAIQAALLTSPAPGGLEASRWTQALATAPGTRWQPHARAAEFAWRARSGHDPAAPVDAPADFGVLLAELADVRTGLDPAARDPLTAQVRAALATLETEWMRPLLQIQVPEVHPAAEPLRLAYGTAGYSSLRFRVSRLTPIEWANRRSPGPRSPRPGGTVARTWTVALADPASRRWRSDVVETDALEPGFYVLVAEASGTQRASTAVEREFVVSGLTAAAHLAGNGAGSVFLARSADGAPLTQTEVAGLAGREGAWRRWSGTTDASGKVTIPAGGPDEFGQQVVVATAGGHPVSLQLYAGGPSSRIVADVFLDRPLYRPGESVQWKIILREQRDGLLTVPTRRLLMTVQLNDQKLVDAQPLRLNRFGTATGEIVLPRNTRPGRATLSFRDSPAAQIVAGPEFFTVDNYVPPALTARLELASGADSLRPGREVVVRVQAGYLSGGPVAGAAVEGTFASSVGYRPFGPNPGPLPQYASWQQELALPRTAVTDASGTAELRLQLPDFVPPGSMLGLGVRVIPDGGQPVQAARSFTVTPTGAIVDAGEWTQTRLARPGESYSFTASIVDGAGDPRPFQGTARLVERRWSEAWVSGDGRVVAGADLARTRRDLGLSPLEALPAPWRRIEAAMVSAPVAELPAEAGANGRLSVAFPLPRPGYFQLQVESADQQLLSFRQSQPEALTVVAADEQTTALAANPSVTQIVGPERLRPGEPLRFLVVLPDGQESALVSVQGDDAETSRRVQFTGRTGVVTFDDLPPALNHLQVSVAASPSVSAARTAGARLSIPLDHAARRLTVDVAPADLSPRPGAASSVRVRVRDAADRPVQAEIALGGSDEAVNQLGSARVANDPAFWERPTPARWQHARSGAPRVLPPRLRDPRTGALRNPSQPDVGLISGWDGSTVFRGPVAGGLGGARDFRAMSVGSGSRLRLDLADEPAAYSVINREFIDTLGITDLAEAATWATGQTLYQGDNGAAMFGRPTQFYSRGNLAGAPVEIQVRRHFASTTLWAPAVVTDAAGEAIVPVAYADNLTRWKFEAYVVGGDGNSFGRARAYTRSTLPLQARLQLPRFLVAGDTAQASALLVNRTDAALSAAVEVTVDGTVTPADAAALRGAVLKIAAQGESSLAVPVKAGAKGGARFTLQASAGGHGDAMVLAFPVLEDGLQQLTAATGRLAAGRKSQVLEIPLPSPLDRGHAQLTVQLSPSYAATILDALPYLVDYPYGCVEQTMNRFLPAVVVRKTLVDLGFDAAAVERRILGRESAADAARRTRTAGIGRLDEVIQDSVSRLSQASSRDGGFGWWPGAPSSDPWMTAYVMWGSVLAREAGVTLPPELESRLAQGVVSMVDGRLRLPVDVQGGRTGLGQDANADGSVALLVAAGARLVPGRGAADPDLLHVFERLYAARDQLPAAGRACLFLASRTLGTDEQRAVLLRNLDNGARRSAGAGLGDTVHWGSTANHWRALDGAVETTSLNLLALLETDPQHPLVEPAINWLLLNRRSNHWDSTRSTAFSVLALARAIAVRRELQPDAGVELRVNGRPAGRVTFDRDSLLQHAAPLVIDSALLRAASNRLDLVRTSGTGPVYITALASAWAAGEAVKPAGNLIAIARGLERMQPQPTLLGTVRLVPQALASGGSVVDGEQVVAKVTLTVPNDLEYVMVEIPKPAGCEPLNALSGWDAQLTRIEAGPPAPRERSGSRSIYREEHDDKSVFFLDRIAAGTWEIRYAMRAMTAGDFRVLPAAATAMYVPEVRANSDARRLRIETAAAQ